MTEFSITMTKDKKFAQLCIRHSPFAVWSIQQKTQTMAGLSFSGKAYVEWHNGIWVSKKKWLLQYLKLCNGYDSFIEAKKSIYSYHFTYLPFLYLLRQIIYSINPNFYDNKCTSCILFFWDLIKCNMMI